MTLIDFPDEILNVLPLAPGLAMGGRCTHNPLIGLFLCFHTKTYKNLYKTHKNIYKTYKHLYKTYKKLYKTYKSWSGPVQCDMLRHVFAFRLMNWMVCKLFSHVCKGLDIDFYMLCIGLYRLYIGVYRLYICFYKLLYVLYRFYIGCYMFYIGLI